MLNETRSSVDNHTVLVNNARYDVRGASIEYSGDGPPVYRCKIAPWSEQALERLQASSTQELRLRFARNTLCLTQVHVQRNEADCIAITGRLSGCLLPTQ